VSAINAFMLGPGVTITHAAVTLVAESGGAVVWVGDGAGRCYAAGLGATRQAGNLEHQATCWAEPDQRMAVVRRLYAARFDEQLDEDLTLQQIRGKEGARVRDGYAKASRETGVPWEGRSYERGSWAKASPVNRALSAANACLYGICHAALIATGFSPGLGFIHAGKMMSFVYDIADLYKMDVTVPIAFNTVAAGTADVEKRVRRICRQHFFENRIVKRIVPDVQRVLGLRESKVSFEVIPPPGEQAAILWDPVAGAVPGGQNYGDKH